MAISSAKLQTKKILLVEDENDFAQLVVFYLKKEGYQVDYVTLGKKALEQLSHKEYPLIILDLGLPDCEGIELCRKIRKQNGTPILILTARDAVSDRVSGLDAGADDYLIKPVSLKELKVRAERLMRRRLNNSFRSTIFRFNGIELDTLSRTLNSENKTVSLTRKENAVLEYLLLKKGQIITRMEVMDHVWGEEINPFSNIVNVTVASIRRKMRQLSPKELIYTMPTIGYKLDFEK